MHAVASTLDFGRALELFGQTREQQLLIRRAYRFSVLAHNGMREGYDRFLAARLP